MLSGTAVCRTMILGYVTLAATAGCRATGDEDSKAGPARAEGANIDPKSDAEANATNEANEAATALVTKLKARLTRAMTQDGPSSALDVCAEVGQSMTAQIGREHGTLLGRSSLRLRNAENQGPDWVTQWLEEQGERPVAGVEGFERIVDTPEGKVARVLRPIGVEKPCLHCHGNVEDLAPEIRTGLEEHYPTDAATGYAVGDLRGALWAQAPVRGSEHRR